MPREALDSPMHGAAQDRALRTKGPFHRSARENLSPGRRDLPVSMFGTDGPFSPSREVLCLAKPLTARCMAQHRTAPYGLRGLLTDGPFSPSREVLCLAKPLTARCMAQHRTAPYGLRGLLTDGPFSPSREVLCVAIPLDSPMHGAAQDRALRTKGPFN